MPSLVSAARVLRAGVVSLMVLTLIVSAVSGTSASHRTGRDVLEATDLADAVTLHMQNFWDDAFERSDLPYETPYAVAYDNSDYGSTGCGYVEDYGYSWYCVADDTVYVNIDQVQDLREQEGDLFAAVLAVGQPMSLAVLDRVGGLTFDRSGGADRYSQEAAACLSGVWTAELWYEDIITEDDVLSAARGLSTVGRTLPEAYLFGYDTEDPQACLDVMLSV